MQPEQYNEYGEIVTNPQGRQLSSDQKHRIHQTKDIFDSNCSGCQADIKKFQLQQSWWDNGED